MQDNQMKFDGGKTRWSLVPWASMKEIAEIMTFGAKKYSANSWQNLDNGTERYTDALIRHLVAHLEGEERDSESGKRHLAHVAVNALFLIHFLDKPNK